jgi:hypothetical protein
MQEVIRPFVHYGKLFLLAWFRKVNQSLPHRHQEEPLKTLPRRRLFTTPTAYQTMSDDKKKKKIDAWFLALSEKYEVQYFVQDIKSELPGATTDQIHDALETCVEQIQPSEGRARIKACVLAKLKPHTHPRPDKDDRPKHPDRTHA